MRRSMVLLVLWTGMSGSVAAGEKAVTLMKTPGQGIQPQAVVDAQGTLHVLYFQGEPRGGNLLYVRRDAGKTAFSTPLRVNSQEGSAIAVGTIRGGQLALGKNGRVHVAWNGSDRALPKNPIMGSPMLYARLNNEGVSFELQRNLMTKSAILDGGGALTADSQGNVYVAWHALGQDLVRGEGNRKVWVSISHDDGKTFAAEKPVWDKPTGACGCCGMRGFADVKGNPYFLYRAASEKVNRGMWVLQSTAGKAFWGSRLDVWKIDTCPMSSEAFAEGPRGVHAAWDNNGQIFFLCLLDLMQAIDLKKAAPGNTGDRKHPALAFNKKGEMILVWTEGTGWNRGGTLAWQVYDKAGNPTGALGRRAGAVPVWGLPAVIAEAEGRFTILH